MIRCPKRGPISRTRALGSQRYDTLGCGSTNVVVVNRRCNYSAFNGYYRTPSDYSRLRCLDCGTHWRSKAKGVDDVRDAAGDEATRAPLTKA